MPTLTGRVTEVKSGDTLQVQFAEGSATVRLHGVDCPELSQPYGPAATKATRKLAGGEQVVVEVVEWGDYDRLIGRVRVDGVDVAQSLVEAGLAWYDHRDYDHRGAPGAEQLREQEQEARAEGQGLWSQRVPIPPWRHRERGGPRERRGRGLTEAIADAGPVFLALLALLAVLILALILVA